MKDNEALRVLKDQNIKLKSNSHENRMKSRANQIDLDETSDMPDMKFCSRKVEPCKPMSRKSTMDDNLPGCTDDQNEQVKGPSSRNKDEDIGCSSTLLQGSSYENSMPCADNNVITEECHVPIPDSFFDTKSDVEMLKSGNKDGVSCSWSMRRGRKRNQDNKLPANVDDEVICFGDSNPVQTSLHIRKEISSSVPASQLGKSSSI